jgi:hypothetical protein
MIYGNLLKQELVHGDVDFVIYFKSFERRMYYKLDFTDENKPSIIDQSLGSLLAEAKINPEYASSIISNYCK